MRSGLKEILILGMVLLVIAGIFFVMKCGIGGFAEFGPGVKIQTNTSINLTKKYPSVYGIEVKYCEGMGHTYEYRLNDSGKYIGYCRLTKDIECPAEDFFNGICHREFTLCEIKGYKLMRGVEKLENATIKYPACIFPDGTYCKEADFFNRRCHVKW